MRGLFGEPAIEPFGEVVRELDLRDAAKDHHGAADRRVVCSTLLAFSHVTLGPDLIFVGKMLVKQGAV
jgi:hypothetical protein